MANAFINEYESCQILDAFNTIKDTNPVALFRKVLKAFSPYSNPHATEGIGFAPDRDSP